MTLLSKPHLLMVLAWWATLGLASAAFGADTKKPGAKPMVPPVPAVAADSFEAFQLVVERNIFNPNRIGRTKAGPEVKPVRVDEISLVGTMESSKGIVAFFDSANSSYRKALRVGESVADFKVEKIGPDGVDLLRGDKPVALKLAQQLRRTEGGEWAVRAVPFRDPKADARGSAATSGGFRPVEVPAVTQIPDDASDALKRLMKKREKDLK